MHTPHWTPFDISSAITLPQREIHVWRAALDLPPADITSLKDSLAPNELARAGKFVFERDKNRFIAARGILRAILSGYTGIPPRDLEFSYNINGKPFLNKPHGFQFNLSHSANLALYAVNRESPVGIDVENIRAIPEMNGIAEQLFSAQEKAVFLSTPLPLKNAEFFRIWTRKEAYLKALGEGITSQPDVPTPEYFLFSFTPEMGYTAALTTKKFASSIEDANLDGDLKQENAIQFLVPTGVSAYLSRVKSGP